MKKESTFKYAQLAGAIVMLLGLSCLLMMLIVMSGFELDLDFSLEGQILRLMDIDKPRSPSLQTPMLLMLLGAFVAVGALIIRQFIEEHLRRRDMLTPQWVDRSRVMQVILGLAAAALLAMIGICLDKVPYDSFLPYALSGMLALRLAVYGVQRVLRKK